MPQNNSDIPLMSLHGFSLKACQTSWHFYCRKDRKFSSEKRRDAAAAAPTCHVWSAVKGGAKCEEVMIPPKMFVNERFRWFSWLHCIWKADHLNLMDVIFILPSVLFRVLKVDHSLFRPFDNWNKVSWWRHCHSLSHLRVVFNEKKKNRTYFWPKKRLHKVHNLGASSKLKSCQWSLHVMYETFSFFSFFFFNLLAPNAHFQQCH